MAKVVDHQHKWALEIGRVFVAFGSMEWSVNILVTTVPESVPPSAKWMFSHKIEFLLRTLSARTGEEESNLVGLFLQMKELNTIRNVIAHNPLVLDIYMSDGNEPAVRELIASQRGGESALSFDDIVRLREESERLSSALVGSRLAFEASGRAHMHRLLKR